MLVRRPALLVFVAALAVRLVVLWAARDAGRLLDEKTYLMRAVALLEGQGFVGSYQSWIRHDFAQPSDLPQYPGAWQPPAYTAFMAGLLAVSGRSLLAVKLAQVLLGALSVVLLLALGRAWFGERAGIAAAWLAALYPNLIAFTHYLFSETLFIFLLLAALAALTPRANPPRPVRALAGGVLVGLAALTRAGLVYFLPLLCLWLILRYRDQRRAALLAVLAVLAATVAVILPWSARNTRLHGGFVLIETNAPYNFWRGNGPGAFENRCAPTLPHYPWPFDCIPVTPLWNREAWTLVAEAKRSLGREQLSDLELTRYASQSAWREIRSDPATFVRRIVPRLVDMWNPTSFLVRHVQVGGYPRLPPSFGVVVMGLSMLSYVAAAVLALIGAWLERRNPHVGLILLLVLFYSGISAMSFGLTRFRLPLEPLLLLLAGVAVATASSWALGRGRFYNRRPAA